MGFRDGEHLREPFIEPGEWERDVPERDVPFNVTPIFPPLVRDDEWLINGTPDGQEQP